jgi:hypothetical protein
VKRPIATIAAALLLTGGSAYALTSPPAPAEIRTTSTEPVVELEPNESQPVICHEDMCGPIVLEPEPTTTTTTEESAPAAADPSPLPEGVTMLPDGNLTAIAQGPPAVAPEGTEQVASDNPATPTATETPAAWAWRSPDESNGWTQSSEGATGCWAAYDIRGKTMRPDAPEGTNAFNYEVMRRQGAAPLACDHADVEAGWDPTVPLVKP